MKNINFKIWNEGTTVRVLVPPTTRFARHATATLNGRWNGCSWEFPCECEAAVRRLVLRCFGWLEGTPLTCVQATFKDGIQCRAGALYRMGRELAVISSAGASVGCAVTLTAGQIAAAAAFGRAPQIVVSPGTRLLVHGVPKTLAERYACKRRGRVRYELVESGGVEEDNGGGTESTCTAMRKQYIVRSLAMLVPSSDQA